MKTSTLLLVTGSLTVGLALGALVPTVRLAPIVAAYGTRIIQGTQRRERLRRLTADRRRRELAAVRSALAENPPAEALRRRVATLPVTELVALQARGEVTAVELLRCFLMNAVEAHERTNCVTHWLLVDAMAAAARCDAQRAAGVPLGALHGVPMSVKETFAVAGTHATMGITDRAATVAARDATPVRLLKEAGAVVMCKTNVPQMCLTFECDNFLYGETVHPRDAARTCGGSSGGEAALLALGGAAAGLGTDVAGSVRIPAAFCGIAGFRPSQFRLPIEGLASPVRVQDAVACVTGPMARNVQDTVLLAAVLSGPSAHSTDAGAMAHPLRLDEVARHCPTAVAALSQLLAGGTACRAANTEAPAAASPLESSDEALNVPPCAPAPQAAGRRPLRVGFFVDDGVMRPYPGMARAVAESLRALRAAGHTVVPWPMPEAARTIDVFYRLMAAHGGECYCDSMGSEPFIPFLRQLLVGVLLPCKSLLVRAARPMDSILARTLDGLRPSTVAQYFGLQAERNRLRDAFAAQFAAADLDALLCPAFYVPAPLRGTTVNCSAAAAYTGMFNLLDAPAVVLPVAEVEPEADGWEAARSVAADGADMRTRESPLTHRRVRAMCGSAGSAAGLPLAVQVVAPRFADERCLGVALELEHLLRQR